MLRRFSPLLAAVVLLAGCGGSAHPQHARVAARAVPAGATGPTVIVGHPCSPANQVMQCVLPPVPAGVLRGAPAPVRQGVDFAWSCPSPSGHAFGASYLSGTSKDWTPGCLAAWHHAGAATVAVWETSGTRALAGFGAGRADGAAAAAEAARLGEPSTRPIFFAVDFDEQPGSQASAVAAYFRGVASAIGLQRTGAYGGYWTVKRLFDAGLIADGWQAYAWSGGLWDPRAHLEQILNGSAVDYDRAIATDYGQWPYVAPKPPGPTPKQRTAAEKARDSSLRAYRAHRCTMPVLGPNDCRTYARRVVYFQGRTGQHVTCWGKRARSSAPVCRIVRPELSVLSRARDASERAYEQHNCAGPATFGNGVHSRRCDQLRQRKGYFLDRAHRLFRAWT